MLHVAYGRHCDMTGIPAVRPSDCKRTNSPIFRLPRTLALLTRSMFGHGGGGWADRWPQFSRLIALQISSFDFARFSLRLFLDAQVSTLDISSSREPELAAGTTRYVSSANFKMRFPGIFGWRSEAVTMNEAGRGWTQSRTLNHAATVEHSPAYLVQWKCSLKNSFIQL